MQRKFVEFFGYIKSEIGSISEKDALAFYNKIKKIKSVLEDSNIEESKKETESEPEETI